MKDNLERENNISGSSDDTDEIKVILADIEDSISVSVDDTEELKDILADIEDSISVSVDDTEELKDILADIEDSISVSVDDTEELKDILADIEDSISVSREEKEDISVDIAEAEDASVSRETKKDISVDAEEVEDASVSRKEKKDIPVEAEEVEATSVSRKEKKDIPVEAEEVEITSVRKNRKKDISAGAVREIINFALYIGIVLLATYLVIHYVGQRTEVSGSSMEFTLSDGDNLIVDKITYRFKDPERFDIIVFPYKHQENTYYIKRIIGMPGETVRIDEDGVIYINGEELVESYGRQVIRSDRLGLAANEITLGDDEYFVLGDNRNESSDSRELSVGNIKREDIIGRAWLRIYPFDKIGFIRHQ